MPTEHDLLPNAMTEGEFRAQRRFEAYFAFETMQVKEEDERSSSTKHEASTPCR